MGAERIGDRAMKASRLLGGNAGLSGVGLIRAAAILCACATALVLARPSSASAASGLEVGFGKADITPDPKGKTPVWLAGFANNRRADRIHDPLWARALVLRDGTRKIAFVSVDLVGFMLPNARNVRKSLKDFYYTMVSSTHNHEGPDTIGLWGPFPGRSGVDPVYMAEIERQIVRAARDAEANLAPVSAVYGAAEDESLLSDSRKPVVKDGVLRVLKFLKPDGQAHAILVQWNCHPENLGSRNRAITADFPYGAVQALEERHKCPVAYFSGAVGGLMSAPDNQLKGKDGRLLPEGDFEFAEVYGRAVADLADRALKQSSPMALTPFQAAVEPVALKLDNPLYKLAWAAKTIDRDAFAWTGDPKRLGSKLETRDARVDGAIETEVGCLRLGELHVAAIPGELYPELVYGRFQDPADPNADHPQASLETPVMKILPGPKALIFGLANDEVGYIIPKRQWDDRPPFAYGRDRKQYGEINSVGPETAPALMQALRDAANAVAANREAEGGER